MSMRYGLEGRTMRRANGSELGIGPTLLFWDRGSKFDMVSTNDALMVPLVT